jgi:hypothetical protein
MAPRHHISGTYPQIYISRKLMLLSLPLCSLNFLDSRDFVPRWIIVFLVLVGNHTQDFLQQLLIPKSWQLTTYVFESIMEYFDQDVPLMANRLKSRIDEVTV